MKVTLEFDLYDLDDRIEHKRCMKATDMFDFIFELERNLCSKWKHDETDFNLDNYKKALAELMEEHNINTDELN
jgi:hypothetical protein